MKRRLLSSLALVATVGFMLGNVSCTTAQLQQVASYDAAYQTKTGITFGQTFDLGKDLFAGYRQAKAENSAAQASPILTTRAAGVAAPSGKTALDLWP